MFGSDSVSFEVKDMNQRFIDAFVRASPLEPSWRLTCVYGEPRVENRHLMWSTIQSLKAVSDLPWMLVGDFNEALWR